MGEAKELSIGQILQALAQTLKPFEQLSKVEQQIENCQNYITHMRDMKKKTKITTAIIILVILDSIVLITCGIFALLLAMVGNHIKIMGPTIIILLIINALVIGLAILIMNNKKRDLEIKAQKAENDLRVLYENRCQIASIIKPYVQFLPRQYMNKLAVEKIYEYLSNGRADSLKEAMNLFEEELFRMRQESRSEQMVRLQRTQNINIEEIRTNTANTASAVEEIANIFNNR